MTNIKHWVGIFGLCCLIIPPDAGAAEDNSPRKMSPQTRPVDHDPKVFSPDPTYGKVPYLAKDQIEIYGGKRKIEPPRPLLELFRPIYTEGPFSHGNDATGSKNLLEPAFSAYGDFRTALAYNDNNGKEVSQIAARLNLDLDLKLTGTERIHAFLRPIDHDGNFSRIELGGADETGSDNSFDLNLETLFFEGDVGSIVGGLSDKRSDFDLPFAVGLTPLLFQNGIWAEDAIVGGAVSWSGKNSRMLDISNADVTFFSGVDKVTSPAAKNADGGLNDSNLSVFGVAAFVEANNGYWEAGYGFIEGDNDFDDIDYHSLTASFTKRYGGWLSNSLRGVMSFGQDRDGGAQQTADGFILLAENSLITSKPSTFVPYLNMFYGKDQPQPLIDDSGLLKNTGINFETDGLTGFPKLDDSGHDSFGGALGLQYLFDLDRQLVFELSSVQVMDGENAAGRSILGDQYAVGIRYQQPITKEWIVRADTMYGHLKNTDDVAGIRFELRRKF